MSDHEVAIARAMLAKGMQNDEVHFYFNRADRLISSGRITNIKKGTYAKDVPAATAQELQDFMDRWEADRSGGNAKGPASPTDLSIINALFEQRNATWFVRDGETDTVECKQNYAVSGKIIRAIAGLANANGGYILFGVKDGTNAVDGMSDNKFTTLDPAVLNSHLTSSLDPVPRYHKVALDIGGKSVGVMHVEKCDAAPVMAVRNGKDLLEGGIYYRYPGETKLIKPGELRAIMQRREERAMAALARHMTRVASGAEATLDLETGQVAGRAGSFVIGEGLLSSIQFVREGDFTQARGAPALRLIGDVQAISPEARADAELVRGLIEPNAILDNYLRNNPVKQPLLYIRAQAYRQKKWMPIWHYVHQLNMSTDELVAYLQSLEACLPSMRDFMVNRLRGTSSAFHTAGGKPARMLAEILAGKIETPTASGDLNAFYSAMHALPDTFTHTAQLKKLLLENLRTAGTGPQSSLYERAVCRLDEIEHAQRQ